MSNITKIKEKLYHSSAVSQLRLALPAHITPERFQRVAWTAIANSEGIPDCTPDSVINALTKCAQDGLMPDNKEAAIVKYGSVATYMPMVYGLIKRMRNSGEVKDVNAFVVYSEDKFEYQIKNGIQECVHVPSFSANRGDLVLAYAVVMILDGSTHIEVMTKAEIEKARNSGRAANSPAWKNWYDEMAKKTVIHRAAKRVPTSADVEKLLRTDMRVTLDGNDESDEPKPVSLVDSINEAVQLEAKIDDYSDKTEKLYAELESGLRQTRSMDELDGFLKVNQLSIAEIGKAGGEWPAKWANLVSANRTAINEGL
jgi:recombination protein RecT